MRFPEYLIYIILIWGDNMSYKDKPKRDLRAIINEKEGLEEVVGGQSLEFKNPKANNILKFPNLLEEKVRKDNT